MQLGEALGVGQGQYKAVLTRIVDDSHPILKDLPSGTVVSPGDEGCNLRLQGVSYQYAFVRQGDMFTSMVVSTSMMRKGYVFEENEVLENLKYADCPAKHLVLLVHGIGKLHDHWLLMIDH